MFDLCTQPKIGSRFGLDSVPNRDVAKSSFGHEEYETVSGPKEGSNRDAFSGDHARIEAVSKANGPRCRVVPEVRH